ncbi:hypothetical protein IVZ55_06015 [Salmonella enterica subsp. enterica serovar Worthington]|nr:hypothetical protein [Salmonella enterica subsp. enterica serovar Worthington]MBP1524554.1 hypothetical protein [Salmonella enterica subsp. enterica serovar Worthington]
MIVVVFFMMCGLAIFESALPDLLLLSGVISIKGDDLLPAIVGRLSIL